MGTWKIGTIILNSLIFIIKKLDKIVYLKSDGLSVLIIIFLLYKIILLFAGKGYYAKRTRKLPYLSQYAACNYREKIFERVQELRANKRQPKNTGKCKTT